MGRPCSVCTSPNRDRIDTELAGGESPNAVGKRYRLGEDSVRRHKLSHLSPALVRTALARRNDESAASAFDATVDRIESLVGRLEGLLTLAEAKGQITGGSNVAREIRQSLELIARLRGELDERPQYTTVNVLATPEFTGIVARLIDALAPYPEARLAAAEVLDVEEIDAR